MQGDNYSSPLMQKKYYLNNVGFNKLDQLIFSSIARKYYLDEKAIKSYHKQLS